jgi:gas vesicle protein
VVYLTFLSNLFGQLNAVGTFIVIVILLIFILAFTVNILIRRRYSTILSDLHDKRQLKAEMFNSELINRIVTEYSTAASGSYSEVNTQAIIEKCFNQRLRYLMTGERFVKNSVSILVVLGLLGTFLGLTISVGELVNVINQTNASDFLNNPGFFITGLVSAVGGMAVAFVTSLAGIACSILLTIMNIVFNVEEMRETLMVHIEEYLDNSVANTVYKDKETEYTMLNRILRETFEEFGSNINSSLKDTMDEFGNKLSHVVMDVHLSSKALDDTVDRFENALKTFASNIRDFSEFNFNLRNNIERMDVNFMKVSDAIAATSKVIADNYQSLEQFSDGMKEAANEMTVYNRQAVQDIGNLTYEIKLTVNTVKELSETLKADTNMRMQEMQEHREKFSILMDRLGNEISLLGSTAAEAFSRELAENGKAVSESIASSVNDILGEVFKLLEDFKENEKIFAKTIAVLPEQTLTYNEAAVAKIKTELDQMKKMLEKTENRE